MQNTKPILQVTDGNLSFTHPLGASHPRIEVLKNINLKINQAESVALIGPSGSGKTSLLGALSGLTRLTEGTVTVDKIILNLCTDDELNAIRSSMVSIVFQHFYLIPTLNALENVALPLELSGHATPREHALECLAKLDMKKRTDHFPHQLSGGEQQRVSIARAFCTQPKVILADEPTGNLDNTTSSLVVDILFKMCEEYKTSLLFVTHDHNLLPKFNRILQINDGELKERQPHTD